MWPLVAVLAPLLFFLLLLLPLTRPVMVVMLTAITGPFIRKFILRVPAAVKAKPLQLGDAAVPEPVRIFVGRIERELIPLGFERAGLFQLGNRGTVHFFVARFGHGATRTSASTTQASLIGGVVEASGAVGMTTVYGNGSINTIHSTTPGRLIEWTAVDRAVLPRVPLAADLFRVHLARVERSSRGEPKALPEGEAWGRRIEDEWDGEFRPMIEAGLMRRERRRPLISATWKGAMVLTAEELPSLRGRIRRRVHEREKRLLADLGMADLLEKPAAIEETRPAELGRLAITDDRSQRRVVHSSRRAQRDERMHDARFRALLAEAAGARTRGMRLGIGWAWALPVAGFVLGQFLPGRLGWAGLLLGIVAMFVISTLRAAGRGNAAEQAAADVLLSHGVCPSCLYSLAGLEAGEDGCLACPECAGAWRAARVREFMVFEQTPKDGSGLPGMAGIAQAREWAQVFAAAGKLSKDDRGFPCMLVRPGLREPIALGGATRERLERARRRICANGRWLRWGAATLIILIFIGVPVLLMLRAPIAPPVVLLAILICTGVMWSMFTLVGNFGYSRRGIRRAMLDQSLCPSCADDLGATAIEQDGCRVCPRCAAAWRLPGDVVPMAAPVSAHLTPRVPPVVRGPTPPMVPTPPMAPTGRRGGR